MCWPSASNLHHNLGKVNSGFYKVPFGKAKIIKKGKDLTLVSYSYSLIDCLKCVKYYKQNGINLELIDLRSIRPLDTKTILRSVKKTKKCLVVDNDWTHFGVSSEILSVIKEHFVKNENIVASRIGFFDSPTPSTRSLVKHYYPNSFKIGNQINKLLNLSLDLDDLKIKLHDIPDNNFKGPF